MSNHQFQNDPLQILVADDDSVTRRLLKNDLESAGYEMIEATDGEEAIALLSDDIDVALFDLQMPKQSGMECLKHLKTNFPDLQAMMISAKGEIRDAVLAMKQGAFEYITKPWDRDELLVHVAQAARTTQLARENRGLRQAFSGPSMKVSVIAEAEVSQRMMQQVTNFAQRDSTVLLTGPSGTGKTTLARVIHQSSHRAAHPFVAVSCANLPRDLIEAELFGNEKGAFTGAVARAGRVEAADKGTLFLDEIGDLALELQPKLLTFLEERCFQRLGGNRVRSVDVRVIAATNQDLNEMVNEGRFRLDLFQRLHVLALEIPPLSQRKLDIEILAKTVLDRISQKCALPPFTLSSEAKEKLLNYPWPGNIRELENVLERASSFHSGGEIQPNDLLFSKHVINISQEPASQQAITLVGKSLKEIERDAIEQTLAHCEGNRADAAKMLGISERTIYNKIKSLNISE